SRRWLRGDREHPGAVERAQRRGISSLPKRRKTMIRLMPLKLAAFLSILITASAQTSAAEIRAFFPGAMRPAMAELIAQFEKTSGHKIVVTYGPVGALVNRLKNGESADLAVESDGVLADLITQG